MDEMNGKEIVNLIDILRRNGFSDTKIIETIIYVITNDPEKTYEEIKNEQQ